MKTWTFTLQLSVDDDVTYAEAVGIADWYLDSLTREPAPTGVVVSVDGLEPANREMMTSRRKATS